MQFILIIVSTFFEFVFSKYRLSQTCNHVAALLFKLESAYRLDLSNPSCTTSKCSWSSPASKKPVFCTMDEMSFKKPSYRKGKCKLLQSALSMHFCSIKDR